MIKKDPSITIKKIMRYRSRAGTTHRLQLLLLLFIIITSSSSSSFLVTSTVVVGHGDDHSRPNPVESAIGISGDPSSPWDKLKNLINIAWLNLLPPPKGSRDDRLSSQEYSKTDAGEVVKEAATKSFETSKQAAEKSAQFAAHALHETAEKVIMKKTTADISRQEDHVQEL